MDHKAFEDNMIEMVNRNSESAEQARKEAYRAAQEDKTYAKYRKKSDAALQMVVWIGAFIIVALCMFWLNRLGIAPGELPEAVCAVAGLATGSRVTTLARVFRK